MPYSSTRELPSGVKKKYSSSQLSIFKAAFNSALKSGKSEAQASKIAHAAAQRAGKKPTTDKAKDSASMDTTLLQCKECDRGGFTEEALDEHAAAVHTHNDIRHAIGQALRLKFPSGGYPRCYTYVRDVSDDWFVYDVEVSVGSDYQTTLFKLGYSYEDGKVTFNGDPIAVRAQMTYVPVSQED